MTDYSDIRYTSTGITVYDTIDDLPLSGLSDGREAFVSATNALYIWSDSGWYNIGLINTNPSITSGGAGTYNLASDGTATVITLTASDPEGIPITWSYSVTSGSLGSIATVSQADNVFTITPSTNEAHAGTFSLTFTASDGVNTATDTNTFTLAFKVQNSKYTSALITSVGSNGGTNSTVTDSSSNNHTVTVNGNTSSQTFSPYRSGGYSYYFDGTDDYLNIPYDATLADWSGTDYTIEAWVYYNSFNVSSVGTPLIVRHGIVASASNYWSFGARSNGILQFYYWNGSAVGSCASTATLDLNTWHHIVMSYNNTNNEITLYLDGVSVHTHTVSGTPQYNSDSTILIGESAGTEHNGYITDLRMTASEVYSTAFTPPTEPLTAITNTKLLTCHLSYLKDGSSNDHSITLNGNVSAKPFAPYDYLGYDAETHGGSVYFDGTGDYISTTSNLTDFQVGTGDFTVEAWVWKSANGTNNYDGVFSLGTSGSATDGMFLEASGSRGILWYSNGGAVTLEDTATCNTSEWIHIAVARSSGVTKLFRNGVEVASTSTSYSVPTTASIFTIGTYGNNFNFNGYICDFRFVKGTAVYTADFTPPTEPLTAITNTSLLISGTDASIIDKSQTINDITLNGHTQSSTTVTKYGSSSMYFDGTGDYISGTLDTAIGTDDFTIEMWVYVEAASGTNPRIFTIGGYGSSSGISLLWLGSGFRADLPASSNGSLGTSTGASYQEWYHIAITRESGTAYFFVDGTEITNAAKTTNISTTEFNIGADFIGLSGYDINAYIEDLRITKGLARYTANFTPPTAALKA